MKTVDRPRPSANQPEIAWKSDVVAQLLREFGIPYIPLNPGASYRGLHDSLVNYLGNEAPQMLLCLHEDHVVSIAHGYAKATDRPLACVLHSNVGLMHGLMGIYNAFADRMPMLVLGATGPVAPERRRPWIDWIHTSKDQGALLRNFVKFDDEPRSQHGLAESLLRALQITTAAPRAPVYVCLDAGLQEERADGAVQIPDVTRFRPPAPPSGSPPEIAHVAGLIAGASRPLFLIGRGSCRQEDWDRRVVLAELSGAAVVTSLRDRAVFPTEHRQHIGPPSGWMTAAAKTAIEEADLIVSFDWVDLNGSLQQAKRDTSRIAATIVHVSLDGMLHNGWSMDHFGLPPADTLVMADPDRFIELLLPALRTSLGERARAPWSAHAPAAARGYSENADREMAPHDIEVALAEARRGQFFTLAHVTIGWAGTDYPLRGPLDYLGHDGGGGLAAGPGLTVGAALALKDSGRIVVGVLGDGDFLQGATALWTAAHYKLPALFIVSNNRSNFNDEIHQETVARTRERPVENRWIGQRIDDPPVDLAGLARSQGVEATGPVESVPELREAIRQGLRVVADGRPFLIDAKVKPGYANVIVKRQD